MWRNFKELHISQIFDFILIKAPTTEAIETKDESEAPSRKSSVASIVEVEKEVSIIHNNHYKNNE